MCIYTVKRAKIKKNIKKILKGDALPTERPKIWRLRRKG